MNKPRWTLVPLAVGLLVAATPASDPPLRFEIDRGHSNVGFVVRHMMIANVRGQFNDFSGTILLDQEDITRSSVSVTIKAASIDTNHEKRDADLRGTEFFEVERFPELRFVSTRIERGEDGFVAVGNLTVRDVTQEVRIPFEVTGPMDAGQGVRRIGIDGAFKINRHEYGLRWNRAVEAGPVVSDDVRIQLSVSAVHRPGT